MKLLIVGNPGQEHIGRHLLDAAEDLGVSATILDVRLASEGPRWKQRVSWHLLGHRPQALKAFNQRIVEACRSDPPDALVATGIAPVTAATLRTLRKSGIRLINYQTDDPWNPGNRAHHFWPALPLFDSIFSPRKAAIPDLQTLGCRRVEYLPFAYNPRVHFVESPPSEDIEVRFHCDVAIIGGADQDRYPLAEALAREGLQLRLYGGYWDRKKSLRPFAGGFVYDQDQRWAACAASVNLCMGRRANRDGHAMRSYELPAMGATLVVENTEDHRALFGAEGECALYYRSISEMVKQVRVLLDEPGRGKVMAQAAHVRVTSGANTYADRLKVMVGSI